MADTKAITKTPTDLTVREVSELKELLKEEYDIEPTAAAVAVAGPAAGVAAEAEKKSPFDAVLKSFGSAKPAVVKAVREHAGLGLKEVKELVDAAPTNIKEGAGEATAGALKVAPEEAGVEAELEQTRLTSI